MLWLSEIEGYLKGARILVIDDSEPFQRLTEAMLHKMEVNSVVPSTTLAEGLHHIYFNQERALTVN